MTPHRLRRTVAVLLTGLAASMLSLVGPVSPAHGAIDCLSEVPDELIPLTGCDDEVPPVTSATIGVSPTRNGQGYIRANSVTFTFGGDHTDADADPVSFECMLYNSALAPDEAETTNWETCTSPRTYPGLTEYTSIPYTFKVRAVDLTDRNLTALDESLATLPPHPDVADHDLTPSKTTIKVDTVEPNTFITRAPQDDIRPDWPVTTTSSPQVTLNSNEAGTFKCQLNGKSYPCSEGVVTLRKLSGGSKTFQARAVDRAGNIDPTASVVKFYVPANAKLNRGSPWKRVKGAGYFGNDYLTANKVGATLKIKGVRNVREVRLLGPTGPKFGKLEVRVGKSQWYTVNQKSSRSLRQVTYLVRNEFTSLQSGTIQIRVKSLPKRGSVRLDAYVARG
jgi:hypothetical protein